MGNTVTNSAVGLGKALSILNEVARTSASANAFVNFLGWKLPPGLEEIGLTGIDLTNFLAKLHLVLESSESEWEDEVLMAVRIGELASAMANLVQDINRYSDELPTRLAAQGDYISRTNIHTQLPRRIFDLLLTGYLSSTSPLASAVLHLMNIFEFKHFEADDSIHQVEHIRAIVHYNHLKAFLSDPSRHLRETYGWGTSHFAVEDLLNRIGQVLRALGSTVRFQAMERRAEEILLGRRLRDDETDPSLQLITHLYEQVGDIGGLIVGLSLFGARPTSPNAEDGGIGLLPIMRGQVDGEIPLHIFEDTVIELSAHADVLRRTAMILRPNLPLDVRTAPSLGTLANGRVMLGFRHGRPDGTPLTLVSFPGGSDLTVRQISFKGGFDKSTDTSHESFFELALTGADVVMPLSEADGFLVGTIGRNRINTPFDLLLGWTSQRGIYFQGAGGVDVTLSLNKSVGPLRLQALHLGFDVQEEGFETEASINGSLTIGPITATIERLGVTVSVSFKDGNLGLFNLSPSFKPPSGVGLAIQGPGVAGGGFLFFDPAKGEYGGVLQLELGERIAVKAIGLLSTRLPDGSKGYSLVLLITAEGFTPIPLGFGFTLTGIGGLLGVNRTVRTETLRQGLKTGTLDSLLFPRDPVRNAPQLVSDLRAVFPPAPGRHVLGPMVQLRWGTPTLLTLDLAVLLELPTPVRLIVLGRLQVLLPNQSHPLVQIRMDALGVLDFNEGTVALDATLYDSRILDFTLTGDMALRARWGSRPNLVLAIGGVHPRFPAPPGLPVLSRLALTLADGANLQLRCQAYLAVTSNTVQFGARVDLHAAGGGFSFDGMLSFDALVQLAPLAFQVDVAAAIALRYRGRLLMGISFSGMLAGPTPWHVEGKATIKILFFKVSVHFERQFGARTVPPLPAAVDVLALVTDALRDRRNWSATLPRTEPAIVTLHETTPAAQTLRVHPLAELTVRERVAPLKRRITKLGTAPLRGGPTTVIVTATHRSAIPQPVSTTPVQEPFALAQFEELRDDELLARPAFETHEAGLTFTPDTVAFDEDPALTGPLRYETLLLDPTRPPQPAQPGYTLSAAVVTRAAVFGAAGQAVLRRHGRARYRAAELVAA
ncbi:MAG: hypothetical protein H8K04_17900 [Nitrospira sp.]